LVSDICWILSLFVAWRSGHLVYLINKRPGFDPRHSFVFSKNHIYTHVPWRVSNRRSSVADAEAIPLRQWAYDVAMFVYVVLMPRNRELNYKIDTF
jgi:hypothetical protein